MWVKEYDREDICDGDIDAESVLHDMHYGPAEMVDAIQQEVNGTYNPLEWSCSQPSEGSWLSLTTYDNFDRLGKEYADVSIHGSLAQLTRLYAHWSK